MGAVTLAIDLKRLTVETVQTVFRAKPHETDAVLRNRQYGILGQARLHIKIPKEWY